MKVQQQAYLFLFILLLTACTGNDVVSQNSSHNPNSDTTKAMSDQVIKTEDEWKNILSKEQFEVLRNKGTERPFTGKFEKFNEHGNYVCGACGNILFSSDTKFDAGCGWPSFFDVIDKSKIKLEHDNKFGMSRIEVMCARCGGHLGHVFDDGPKPTGMRYCINSVSLDFKSDSVKTKK